MDVLCSTYREIFKMHATIDVKPEMIKKKILENIEDMDFSRPNRKKCEMVCSVFTKNAALGQASEHSTMKGGVKKLFDAACLIRQAILKHRENPWTFEGSLNPGSEDIPPSLYNLVRWIIEGPQTELTVGSKRANILLKTATNIPQSIMYEVKSPRQMKLTQTCAESGFWHLASKHENPHVIAVGLKVHTYTRSKHLVNYLHANNVSVEYTHILRIETQLAEAVLRRMNLTQGVYVPPGLKNNMFVFFAVDNIDFAEDTVDGKDTVHGTMMTVYQQEDALADPVVRPLELEAPSSRSLKSPHSCG